MMRSLVSAAVATGMLLAAGVATAQDRPGGRLTTMQAGNLLRMCQSPQTVKMCEAYLSGISDGITLVESAAGPDVARKVCTPAVKGNQLRSAVVAWLNKHNDRLAAQVGPVVYDAMAEIFPCKGGEGASKP